MVNGATGIAAPVSADWPELESGLAFAAIVPLPLAGALLPGLALAGVRNSTVAASGSGPVRRAMINTLPPRSTSTLPGSTVRVPVAVGVAKASGERFATLFAAGCDGSDQAPQASPPSTARAETCSHRRVFRDWMSRQSCRVACRAAWAMTSPWRKP